ncbi:MAG: mycothiol system anti-sigma-R factor [Bifidobacteriaceae bacterium]|jgi:mycothiol system anti-sigma-R factor|nr:mycothiol system anti-sigma-R factor [Bifidobacteriaceae bacterium]
MKHGFGIFHCDDFLSKLHRFIDDELHAGELTAVLLHLEGCDSCAHEADVHLRLKSMVKIACAEVAPDHLRERIAARIADFGVAGDFA